MKPKYGWAIVVDWPCCEGLLGLPFLVLDVRPGRESVTCSSCGTTSKVIGPLLKYRADSDYLVPAAWVQIIDLEELRDYGPVEIAAERLGVTPNSLRYLGMDEEWFSNPENMPPEPGSWRWIKKGSPLWSALREEIKKRDGKDLSGETA
jgi:hypothetical protein